MPAAALVLALATSLASPPQDAIHWGETEWVRGVGPMSSHHFRYGARFPSAHFLQYGAAAGSFYYLIFGNGPGSAYFWEYGDDVGSAYYWRYGREEGSRHFWTYGQGCLSREGWRAGATCSPTSRITFQTLCIARVIDLEPCRHINAELNGWLERSSGLSSQDPAVAIGRMREAID